MKIPDNVKSSKNTSIIITVTGYVYNPGTQVIMKKLTDKQFRDFVIYMAESMALTLKSAIDRQRFKAKNWPPLSIKYFNWKKRKHYSLNIWECTGTLKDEIKIFKKGKFIAVGFKQKDEYSNSGMKINTIAKYVEYGTKRMPPRPLFRLVIEYMRKHVSDYFKSYQKALKNTKKKYLYL